MTVRSQGGVSEHLDLKWTKITRTLSHHVVWLLTPEREHRWLYLAELFLQRRSLWKLNLLNEVFDWKMHIIFIVICFSPTVKDVFKKTLKDKIVLMWIDQVAGRPKSKIILLRIISVVWLTNFLSEILTQSTHDDELTSFLWAWRGGRAHFEIRHIDDCSLSFDGEWRRELSSEWLFSIRRDLDLLKPVWPASNSYKTYKYKSGRHRPPSRPQRLSCRPLRPSCHPQRPPS